MSKSPQKHSENDDDSNKFLLGVVEGFYGRPFTSEQRKELFKKLKRFGLQLFIYAPKDDCKHRAMWRELYTVEEGEHLQGLINAAKSAGIDFYYALSPGLDITYSSIKDTSSLKRKLDQVSQFGCQKFALLFDDIDSEMTKPDKEMFQSFAHAQVSVSNDIYNHLATKINCLNFLFCPTQYCSSRAIPTVTESEYLNTIGQKLLPSIDVLWTGSKVISKIITVKDIEEITEVLKRKPVIWDNIHANDYDQKRVFLGPYSGRNCELIPLLRGVVTNPNCEFHANTVAIHTLAQWSRCNSQVNTDSISDIKLETENEDCDECPPNYLSENMYHPRVALKNAIRDWLPDFFEEKKAFGPMLKPQPASALTPIIPPIIPKINTCMTLTLTTTSSGTIQPLPEVNTAQLHALADICSNVQTEAITKASVMNSLVSETKVVTTDSILAPILSSTISENNLQIRDKSPINVTVDVMEVEKASTEPSETGTEEAMDCGTPKHTLSDSSSINSEPHHKDETGVQQNVNEHNEEIDKIEKSQLSDDVVMTDSVNEQETMQEDSISEEDKCDPINYDDILLLCDLFYLPFEHGKQGLMILNEFQWLKTNAYVLSGNKNASNSEKTEVQEWFERSKGFLKLCEMVLNLMKKIALCVNRELCYDLYTYCWEMSNVVSICDSYVQWLTLGHFPSNSNSYIQGSFTWFSKGWKETFMSGDQEPWIFRGGLVVDIQRLVPIDSGNDLFIYRLPETPTLNFFSVRPYNNLDENDIYKICHKTCRDGSDCTDLFPSNLQEIASDRLVAPFVTLNPEFCMVVENNKKSIVGYGFAAPNAKHFYRSQETLWLPIAREKYPLTLLDSPDITPAAKDAINWFHNFKYDCAPNILIQYPSIVHCSILKEQLHLDSSISKRLMCVLLASLRTSGSSGCHVILNKSDKYLAEFYGKLGFTEIYHEDTKLILGRNF